MDSEYKVFILDEVHSLSNQAWQAFLKTLEEPPATAIFIMCTTNPERVPATILSRAQRYNFQKISTQGIVDRLKYILTAESIMNPGYTEENDNISQATEYIAKLAEGGMRDAITLLDKCLSYSTELTVDNVVKALGVADYDTMVELTDKMFNDDVPGIIKIVNDVYSSGVDLKQFVKTYFEFILDLNVLEKTGDKSFVKIPETYLQTFREYDDTEWDFCEALLKELVDLSEEQLVTMAASFGSGMGNMKGSCGALVGAEMIAGLVSGGNRAIARQINEKFEELCGSITCEDLKGIKSGKVLCSCPDCCKNAILAFGCALGLE